MKRFDLITIGDITIDAFIKLKDAKVSCDINEQNCTISMRFGDKIPFESVTVIPAVGNSINAAVSAHRIGLSASPLTWIGKDRNGEDCLHTLKKEKIDTSLVQKIPNIDTNYHYVLSYEAERTILIKHAEFPYKLPALKAPKAIYLSSLAPNSTRFHEELATYLESNPEVKFIFQPGTFQMSLGLETLKKIYTHSWLFFCNKEEAQKILDTKSSDIRTLLTGIRDLGPKIPIITDGPRGAHALDGDAVLFVPQYPDATPPVNRTGAGDAFASTVTSALLLGEPLEKALLWGPINSMSVVHGVGAQKGLLSRKELLSYLQKAPPEYKVQKS